MHNVELNFIRNRLLSAGCGCPLSVDLLAGVSMLPAFAKTSPWGGLANGCVWGQRPRARRSLRQRSRLPTTSSAASIRDFNLRVFYQACRCLKFFVMPKIGIYDNVISRTTSGPSRVTAQSPLKTAIPA